MNRIRVAIQKSGRLSEQSRLLLERCGMQFARSKDKLFCYGKDFPVDLLLVRDDDIPRMLFDGVCDLGIVGDNIAREAELEQQGDPLPRLRPLGFGHCRLSLAIPERIESDKVEQLDGQRIATSYPNLTRKLLSELGVTAEVIKLSGSVEIAPGLGTADAIADLVSTGTTLRANHLRELTPIFQSQASLYGNNSTANPEQQLLLNRLLQRLDGVLQARESKYVMLHAPRNALQPITQLLPGAEHPTLLPLEGDPEKVAVHAVCRETLFWEHLEALKSAGASAILVMPVEKMLT